jgi:hypothetical protein
VPDYKHREQQSILTQNQLHVIEMEEMLYLRLLDMKDFLLYTKDLVQLQLVQYQDMHCIFGDMNYQKNF